MKADASTWLKRIQTLDLPDKIRLMNVCGGHERSISMAGLRTALPDNIELIPGPGCPVCVCPEEDIYQAIQIALNENVIAAAGIDVMEQEPINADNPLLKLFDKEKILITPHMAWASKESRELLVEKIARNIEVHLKSRS